MGAGHTELVRMIFGADKLESGRIYVNGQPVKISSPAAGIRAGIGMIPEGRKRRGCLLTRSIKVNTTLSCIRQISRLGFVNRKKEVEITKK
ncbi:MAG: hypothetical protein SOZ59_00165 [Candidatus Limivivens sp.]|nr:hypothetical protein [Candidatus Limivivens sp.]